MEEPAGSGGAAAHRLRRQSSGFPMSSSGRTLLDVMVDGEAPSEGGGPGGSWRGFKEHLRLHRAGAAWAESSGQSDVVLGSRPVLARTVSVRGQPPPAVAARAAAEEEERPATMSLMALMEQADREMGYTGEDGEEEEEEEEEAAAEEEEGVGGGEEVYVCCCVCMVRHKGAAFVPCGHTFCRLCSRELWVSRGNCPLCNGFILEILDIF